MPARRGQGAQHCPAGRGADHHLLGSGCGWRIESAHPLAY
jgi:hypothetical protein